MNRGERRYRSNRAAKRRICEIRNESWGWRNPEFGWHADYRDAVQQKIIKTAKTRHPYGGDTRRLREECLERKRKIQNQIIKQSEKEWNE